MYELDDATAVRLLHEHLKSYIQLYEVQALDWEGVYRPDFYFIVDIAKHYRTDVKWRKVAGDTLQIAADAANLKKMFAEKKKNNPRTIK